MAATRQTKDAANQLAEHCGDVSRCDEMLFVGGLYSRDALFGDAVIPGSHGTLLQRKPVKMRGIEPAHRGSHAVLWWPWSTFFRPCRTPLRRVSEISQVLAFVTKDNCSHNRQAALGVLAGLIHTAVELSISMVKRSGMNPRRPQRLDKLRVA